MQPRALLRAPRALHDKVVDRLRLMARRRMSRTHFSNEAKIPARATHFELKPI